MREVMIADEIRREFEVQRRKLGFSMVELPSTCPTNRGVTPFQAIEWLEEHMTPYYPLSYSGARIHTPWLHEMRCRAPREGCLCYLLRASNIVCRREPGQSVDRCMVWRINGDKTFPQQCLADKI